MRTDGRADGRTGGRSLGIGSPRFHTGAAGREEFTGHPTVRPSGRPSRNWVLPSLVIGGLALTPLLVLTREFIAAGHCVTAGGSYDYLRALCFMSGTRAAGAGLHSPLAWVSLLFVAKLGAIRTFGLRSATRRPLVLLAMGMAAAGVVGRRLRVRIPGFSSRSPA